MITRETIEKEYNDFVDYIEKIKHRASFLEPFHEDCIVFLRLDMDAIGASLISASELSSDHKFAGVFKSEYGFVLETNKNAHYDEFMELKKNRLKPGDVFKFNPEVAWSFNIKGFMEIWTLSIQNIMVIDRSVNIFDMKRASLEKRLEVFSNRK